jgi:hypothetical protein
MRRIVGAAGPAVFQDQAAAIAESARRSRRRLLL